MTKLYEKYAASNNPVGRLLICCKESAAPVVFKMNTNQRTERQLSNPLMVSKYQQYEERSASTSNSRQRHELHSTCFIFFFFFCKIGLAAHTGIHKETEFTHSHTHSLYQRTQESEDDSLNQTYSFTFRVNMLSSWFSVCLQAVNNQFCLLLSCPTTNSKALISSLPAALEENQNDI